MTTSGRSLCTLAVAVIRMVRGLEPQRNRMMPPRATAATTLADVQLAGVPLPTHRSGCDVSTALCRARHGGMPVRVAGSAGRGRSRLPAATAGTQRTARESRPSAAPRRWSCPSDSENLRTSSLTVSATIRQLAAPDLRISSTVTSSRSVPSGRVIAVNAFL